jgi:uncharacterized membrane protein YqjE
MYLSRLRGRDRVVAFLRVNVAVLAVATVLGSSEVGVGLGLGLFGVLSIIRLRSCEISQTEVAYHFASLALGLMAGLSTTINPLVIALMALMVLVLLVGDNPRLVKQYRQQTVQLAAAALQTGSTAPAGARSRCRDREIERDDARSRNRRAPGIQLWVQRIGHPGAAELPHGLHAGSESRPRGSAR